MRLTLCAYERPPDFFPLPTDLSLTGRSPSGILACGNFRTRSSRKRGQFDETYAWRIAGSGGHPRRHDAAAGVTPEDHPQMMPMHAHREGLPTRTATAAQAIQGQPPPCQLGGPARPGPRQSRALRDGRWENAASSVRAGEKILAIIGKPLALRLSKGERPLGRTLDEGRERLCPSPCLHARRRASCHRPASTLQDIAGRELPPLLSVPVRGRRRATRVLVSGTAFARTHARTHAASS
jgi:hypothetical protein